MKELVHSAPAGRSTHVLLYVFQFLHQIRLLSALPNCSGTLDAKLGFALTASQAMHTLLHTGDTLGSQSSRTMSAGVGHPKQSVPADADRQAKASTRGCSDLPHV